MRTRRPESKIRCVPFANYDVRIGPPPILDAYDRAPPASLAHRPAKASLPEFRAGMKDGLVQVSANGMTFRARVWGLSNEGPAVMLVHGFPASSIMWDQVGSELAEQGYRVFAYDQRGISPDARPDSAKAYHIKDYIKDARCLADAVGFQKFHLVGHDVGAVVAWGVSMAHPERLHSLSTLSIPNPDVLKIRPYVDLFSIPWLPEAILQSRDSKMLYSMLPQGRTEAQDAEYKAIFDEPGALSGGLNFYRQVRSSQRYLKDELRRPIDTNTLFLYGEGEGWVNDDYLMSQQTRMTDGASLDVQRIEDAGTTGHFLVETQPRPVIASLLVHFANNPPEEP